MARLLFLATLLLSASGFRTLPAMARQLQAGRALTVQMEPIMGRMSSLRMEEGAEETPPAEEAPAPAPSGGTMPDGSPGKFLGLFDTSQPDGALFASIIVSVGFVILVEFVKFIDPNNAGDQSIFGKGL